HPAMRILVVDDHRNTRETLAMGLALSGYAADTASGVLDAQRLCRTQQYDVIVCDVRMPDGNGVEFASHLRALHPHVRLVLITANELTEREAELARAVGAELLIKPVNADVLALYCRESRAWSAPPP
ncbi:MAG TPA: response regulator, partial [Vicinamibacterales bacterium]|nr:response regulator [Vicinamibacterales bacterium]